MHQLEHSSNENKNTSKRYRINLTLFIILVVSLIFWFHKHLQLYVTETIFIGGTLTLWGFWKLIQSWVKWGLEKADISLAQRVFGRAAATEYIVFGLVLLSILYFATSSIYLIYEGGKSDENEFIVKVTCKDQPYTEDLIVNLNQRSTGRPFFFRTRFKDLTFDIDYPSGFAPIIKRFYPWTNIQLKVPSDFERKDFRVLCLIPVTSIFNYLPKTCDKPQTTFYLLIEHNGKKYSLKDFRKQTVYVGGKEKDIQFFIAKRNREEFRLALHKFLDDKGYLERKNYFITAWTSEPAILPTDEDFKPDDQIDIKIGNNNDPNDILFEESITISTEKEIFSNIFLEARSDG